MIMVFVLALLTSAIIIALSAHFLGREGFETASIAVSMLVMPILLMAYSAILE